MCEINLFKNEGFVQLEKQKVDGIVEYTTISDWATKEVLHAITSVMGATHGMNIKTHGYRIMTTEGKTYLSIRNLKYQTTLFVPRCEVGRLITKLANYGN